MTTTYDPQHPAYLDEADARIEMSRVFDVCGGCRRCTDACPSFGDLFASLDRLGGQDAGMMTPAEQDHVVDGCSHCSACVVNCPYVPGVHDAAVDFPRLMLRAVAMRGTAAGVSPRGVLVRLAARHADRVGAFASSAARFVNPTVAAVPRSIVRRVVARVLGVSDVRTIPGFARTRFSAWFARRPRTSVAHPQGRVVVHPTCVVEYRRPEIGAALVKVFEHNGVQCDVSAARCCGAPMLRAGDVRGFTRAAVDNVAMLAAEIRRGADVVVAQPECLRVVRRDYVDHVGGPDAQLVAEHAVDPCEYLMRLHRGEGTSFDTNFGGVVPSSVAYDSSPHLRVLGIGDKGRDVLKLTGARVTLDDGGAAYDPGAWGLRSRNAQRAVEFIRRRGERLTGTGAEVVAGDDHVANVGIGEVTGCRVAHPLEIIAEAYGFDGEPAT